MKPITTENLENNVQNIQTNELQIEKIDQKDENSKPSPKKKLQPLIKKRIEL